MRKVKIGGHRFAIKKVKGLRTEEGQALYGRIVYKTHQILYDPENTSSMNGETILHELMHGVDQDRRSGLTEAQIDLMAAGMFALFEDNPAVFGTAFMDYVKKMDAEK